MDPAMSDDRSEICFFDLETTFPERRGQGRVILEFGAILVCPKRLVELKNYSSLVRPDDLSSISTNFARNNGITRDTVAVAPSFSEIADKVHDFLHRRVWAGHNIERFDCVIIKEAFEKIGKPAPEPKGIIDSLTLLPRRFGKRAGDMKMATLANYFKIGKQNHRSLDDVRMNLQVLKCCATVLFLESSLPDILTADRAVSDASDPAQPYPFEMGLLMNEIKTKALPSDVSMEEIPERESSEISPATAIAEGSSGYAGFLEPGEVCVTSVSASLLPYYIGTHRIKLLYKDVALQLFCPFLSVRLGIRLKFLDQAGRPRLSFVVDASPSLSRVLDACDAVAKKFSQDFGSNSEWRPVVDRNDRYNSSTVRLHIPTVVNGEFVQYETEIHQKGSSGTVQKLGFSKFDVAEPPNLIRTGIYVDAFFSVDTYDYQQAAGIRLVAKKLVIHSD